MTRTRIPEVSALEGRQVCVALADGQRIVQLVSAGRGRAGTLWLFTTDAFISLGQVVDLWEAR